MSDTDCRNDCVPPLGFPRRPGTETAVWHGRECSCGCGAGGGVSSDNRPALSHFNYRIGTYVSIRDFLFHQLNKTAELANWTHRGTGDPAVALIDGAAILGDILTFYQEVYANESFLRTARWRESIADLVRLLGYRLSPPVGGKATFAFELKKDEAVKIPSGFPLKATLEALPQPAVFETLEEVTAYPSFNRFNLFRPLEKQDITPSTVEFCISAPEQLLTPIAVVAGDRLMIGESSAGGLDQPSRLENAEIVIVDSVRELHGEKIFKIKGRLKRSANVESLVAYKIGRAFHHFGHNSPATIVDESKSVSSTATVEGTTTTSSTTIPKLTVPKYRPVDKTLSSKALDMQFGPKEFPLDTDVGPFPNNVPVIIQAGVIGYKQMPASWFRPPHQTFVGTVKSHKAITAKWGAISGTVTQLNLAAKLNPSETSDKAMAEEAFEAAKKAGEFVKAKKQELETAASLYTQAELGFADALANKTSAHELHADAKAKAISASANAASLAIAQETAATALKDGTFDIAVQALAGQVKTATDFFDEANTFSKSITDRAIENVGSAEGARTQADNARNNYSFIPPDPVLGPIAVSVLSAADSVVNSIDFNDLKNKATAIRDLAEPVSRSLGDAMIAGSLLKTAVDALIEVAKQDADATARFEAAKGAAVAAKGLASEMDNLVVASKSAVKTAFDNVAAAEMLVRDRKQGLEAKIAEYDEAVGHAEVTAQARKVRMYIGDALFHEVLSPLFRIRRPKREYSVSEPRKLNFCGTANEVSALLNRRLMFVKPGSEPFVATVNEVPEYFDAATSEFRKLRHIGLSEIVDYADFPNENPTVTVFGNLVDADEGSTLPEVPIGSGDAKQIFQNFKLPKSPLTYHNVSANTPSETPELAIYVDGRQWSAVDSFFGRGKDEEIYIVREDADGKSWVQFGDGKTGARLTTGANNVTAVYRIGDGAFGPLKTDTKVQASAKLKNLDKIEMPSVATGGAPSEDGDNARNAAPGKVQSLGRIVSLRDFESEVTAIPGVAAATASWRLYDDLPVVQIVLLMETGRAREVSDVQNTISGYSSERGAGRDPVRVVGGGRRFVTAKIEYGLSPGFRADLVEPEIRRALGVNFGLATRDEDQSGLFSLRRRRFGGAEHASSIEAFVQNLEGVVWARVLSFQEMGVPEDPPASLLFNPDDPETYVVPGDSLKKVVHCDSTNVLSLFDKHLFLIRKEATG